MKIIPCGSRITTLLSGIEGIITEISITNSNALYKISYFSNGESKTCWLNDYEFKVTDGKKQDIGFHKPKN